MHYLKRRRVREVDRERSRGREKETTFRLIFSDGANYKPYDILDDVCPTVRIVKLVGLPPLATSIIYFDLI